MAGNPYKNNPKFPKNLVASPLKNHHLMSKFTSFLGEEALNLAAGYLAGLTASSLVSQFFVKKGLANLWGLASKRQALAKDDYEWLMIITSYLIGLAVMISVNYGMRKLRSQRIEEVE